MSLVNDKGKILGTYKNRIVTIQNGVPTVIYSMFETIRGVKLGDSDNIDKEAVMPEISIPISKAGKIPESKVTDIWAPSFEVIQQGDYIGLPEFRKIEKEMKMISESIEPEKKE
jgi:hypothetical protein